MADGILVAALRLEVIALRRGVTAGDPGARSAVLRLGMGPRRAARTAAGLPGDASVVVAGLGGACAPHVRVGDVVVADAVLDETGTVRRCPSAALLAAELRRLGLTVHVGPVASRSHVVRGQELRALGDSGVLAVDMESAAVARAVDARRPFAVVRVVTDTPTATLPRPTVARDGARALATLRRLAPVLDRWCAAAAHRDVTLAAPRSFCAGVERAIDIVERAIDRYGAPVYVRRQIVHNVHVVADLEARGAVFVAELDEVPVGARAVLAAHGVAPAVREQAVGRSLSVIDATCPLVAKVHNEVRRYAAADHTVLMIGHADHEEVVGTVGEAPERVRVVADQAEARAVAVDDPERVAYVMQTTLAVDEADRISGVLRERFPTLAAPRQDDICYATSNRQRAVREIADDCDMVLVVGSPNSSNSVRLVEVARRSGIPAYLVDDVSQVELDWLPGVTRVGLTAGASAPPHLVDGIVDALSGLGDVTVREHRAVDEDVRFTLPKEVS